MHTPSSLLALLAACFAFSLSASASGIPTYVESMPAKYAKLTCLSVSESDDSMGTFYNFSFYSDDSGDWLVFDHTVDWNQRGTLFKITRSVESRSVTTIEARAEHFAPGNEPATARLHVGETAGKITATLQVARVRFLPEEGPRSRSIEFGSCQRRG